jgi:hypothetical protein
LSRPGKTRLECRSAKAAALTSMSTANPAGAPEIWRRLQRRLPQSLNTHLYPHMTLLASFF